MHVPEFEINNTAIDRVSMYKYLGHCINDELSDDNDMMQWRIQSWSRGVSKSRKFKWLVKIGASKGVTLLI